MLDKTYIAIDLKSFYASVECQELGKDPLTRSLQLVYQGTDLFSSADNDHPCACTE